MPASGDHARVSDEVWEQYKGHFVGMFRPPHERTISSFAYFGHLKGSFERVREAHRGHGRAHAQQPERRGRMEVQK